MGKPMIMGRATCESIGRALPGRQSIVVTRQAGYRAEGFDLAATPDEALRLAGDVGEVMVIGGGEIYTHFLPLAQRIYLTRVHVDVEGDTYFPPLNRDEWRVTSSEDFPADEDREIGFTVEVLDRN